MGYWHGYVVHVFTVTWQIVQMNSLPLPNQNFLQPTNHITGLFKNHRNSHTYHGHQSCLICFLHLLRSKAPSFFNLCAITVFLHNLSPSFLWSNSWPDTLNFFSKHLFIQLLSSFCSTCHTIATCFAVVLRLCHLILVSLSTLYSELYLVA